MKNRKLLIFVLLATLKHQEQTYATLYPDPNNTIDSRKNYRITNDMLKPADLNGNLIISVQKDKYAEIQSDVNIGIEAAGTTTKKIINIATGNSIPNFTINKGTLKGTNKGTGIVEAIAIQNGKFRNEGIIDISGDKGFGINVTNKAEIENSGSISAADKAKGVYLNYDNLHFKNDGTVSATGNGTIGISGANGKIITITSGENGVIKAENRATGVEITDKTIFQNKGKVIVEGELSTGINLKENASFTNDGTVSVSSKDKATGILLGSANAQMINSETGIINVSGTGASGNYAGTNTKGIYINNIGASAINKGTVKADNKSIAVYTIGNFENMGKIESINNSVGIDVRDSSTVNKGEITAVSSRGVAISEKESIVFENEGTINISGNNGSHVGIYTTSGTDISKNGVIKNSGVVNVSGENTTGIQAGKNREIINSGTVNIEAAKYTSGVKAIGENSKVINDGKIIHRGDNSNTSNAAISQSGGNIVNNGEINVDSGKLSSAMAISQNSFGTNSGSGKINLFEGTGMKIEQDGIAINEGEINILFNENQEKGFETTGVNLLSANKNSFENRGTINVNGTGNNAYSGYNPKGIYVNNDNAKAVNKGAINVNNTGIGVISKGSFVNDGTLDIENKAIGLNILKADTLNSEKTENNSIIYVKGESYGIQAGENANFENTSTGKIYIETGSTGIITAASENSGTNGNIVNAGNMFVSGERTTGIQANKNREIVNNGFISIEGEKYTSGIKAYGENSKVINNGKIIHKGDETNTSNATISQSGGKIENRGEITVESGKLSSAMAISQDSFGENTSTGKINMSEGIGLKIEQNGIGVNKGKISLNSLNSLGVQLSNSIFISDDGKIDNDVKNTLSTSNINFLATIYKNSEYNAINSKKDTNNVIVLKGNSEINGKIVGNTGVDSLFFENANISGLNIEKYNAINVISDSIIKDSALSLEGNANSKQFVEETSQKLIQGNYIGNGLGTLTIKDSTITLSKTNDIPIYTVGNKVVLEGKTDLLFKGNQREYSTSDFLGGIVVDGSNAAFEDTLVWNYRKIEDKDVVLTKNKYSDILQNKYLDDFTSYLDGERSSGNTKGDLDKIINKLELQKDRDGFYKTISQLSGVTHAYNIDIALMNSRLFSETALNKLFSKDITRNRALNSTTQDLFYIDKTNEFSGALDVSHEEKGIVGVSEKQIVKNNKLGIIYGISKGETEFKNESGDAESNTVYLGGYYDYALNDKISFLTNVGTTYSHVSTTRRVGIDGEEYRFDSSYPIITLGAGTKVIYTPIEKNMFKLSLYTGLDAKRIFQGNINENSDKNTNQGSNLAIKNIPVSEKYYNSITSNIGFNIEKNGYFMNRPYRLGIGVGFEKEFGNIKDYKTYKLAGLNGEHRIKSADFENMFYYDVNANLGLTENLTLTANYKFLRAKDFKAQNIGVGFEYKTDSLFKNNFLNNIVSGLNNNRALSRWRKTVGFTLEVEDPSNRSYYYGNTLSSGDYLKSSEYKPILWLSLADSKSAWSYYFEGSYKDNGMFQGRDPLEDKRNTRNLVGEIRYRKSFSKGNYGFMLGYENEEISQPKNYKKDNYYVFKTGIHEFKNNVNFDYNLGSGLIFTGRTTGMVDFHYRGERNNQKDYKLENQYGFIYNGLSPKWKFQLMYFREDRWYDSKNEVERYELTQLRPTITYFFGNGDNLAFDARLPLGHGAFYRTSETKEIKSETYEYRYGIKYTKAITPGLNVFASVSLSDIKVKNTDTKSSKYGETTRYHVFRPSVGISYSF